MVLPVALSVAGSLLPSVISALVGAKTEAEARKAVQPKYEAMVAQLIGRGSRRAEAEEKANEAIGSAVQEEMGKGAIPAWAELALGAAGGLGGWLAGTAMKGAKAGAKAVASGAAAKPMPRLESGQPKLPAPSAPAPSPNAKTAEFSVRPQTRTTRATEVDPGMTTMDGVPLNLDDMAVTVAEADMPTLAQPFGRGLAETQRINPKLARTQVMDPATADTVVIDPEITQLMAPFRR